MAVPKKLYTFAKWGVLALAYGFLIYKLVTFDDYATFIEQIRSFRAVQFWWLAFAALLLPLNLFLESVKWRLLVANLESLSFASALRSVLIGHTGGFATPVRLGEYPMRSVCLKSEVRLPAVAMGFVGSFIQNFIITVCGVAALCFFKQENLFSPSLLVILGVCAVVSCFVLFCLPNIAAAVLRKKPNVRFVDFWKSAATFSHLHVFKIVAVTFVRYVVFSFQFYLILQFCGVPLSFFAALTAIPVVYLCVTYTPSVAVAEAAVRSSYAILVVGFYSSNIVGIALAGIFIWLLNSAIPMILGSFTLHFRREC